MYKNLSFTKILACVCCISALAGAASADPAEAKAGLKQSPGFELPQIEGAKPWTNKTVNNDPMNFQFAVVTDRNGGERPGIFEEAVKYINILKPEFVMSIGDYIPGYTKDENLLKAQWEEFDKIINSIQMPFFYIPGNHDILNPVQKEVWKQRRGPAYYHFKYGEVLFLCLNSDDPDTKMSEEQVAYFEKALAENKDVRWTLVFVHKPLWVAGDKNYWDKDQKHPEVFKNNGWERFDKALQGRKYTIFSGHIHHYVEREQNGNQYLSLATTGGGSGMRGAFPYGEFDHFVWVSMTPDGPSIANIELSGLRTSDFINEKTYGYSSALVRKSAVKTDTVHIDSIPFDKAEMKLKLENTKDIPLTLEFDSQDSPIFVSKFKEKVTLAPGEKKTITIPLTGSKLDPSKSLPSPSITWKGEYTPEGIPPIRVQMSAPLLLNLKRKTEAATPGTAADGDIKEWENKWSEPSGFAESSGNRNAYKGLDDLSIQTATSYDDKNLYIAVKVKDDSVIAKKDDKNLDDDIVIVQLDPTEKKSKKKKGIFTFEATPPAQGEPNGSITIKGVKNGTGKSLITPEGYAAEFQIPIDSLGKNWTNFDMNVILRDRDQDQPKMLFKASWKPGWAKNPNTTNRATFYKQ